MKTIICIRCDIKRKIKEFDLTTSKKRRKVCKYCRNEQRRIRYWHPKTYASKQEQRRRTMLKKRYGISYIEYDKMLEKQNGVCAICKGTNNSMNKRLAVDHCHKTGEIRSLLCDWCNNILGRSKDNPELLYKCAAYLEAFT